MAKENFENPDHALIAGMILGVARNHDLTLIPCYDGEGNYTDRFEVRDPGLSAMFKVFITVEPPEKRYP